MHNSRETQFNNNISRENNSTNTVKHNRSDLPEAGVTKEKKEPGFHSAIYTGTLTHQRYLPKHHYFLYHVFMVYLDLDELDSILNLSPWWSHKAFRPVRFKRCDFLGGGDLPLRDAVKLRIKQETGVDHDGPIRMLANLRYFGFNMNPIACYYCFDLQGELRFIVAEVNNTPWDQRHSYVLPCDPTVNVQRIQFNKLMHVSPFNKADMEYHWRSNSPGKILNLNIETRSGQEKTLQAILNLQREAITRRSLNSVLWRFPFMTLKVIGGIYWQAMKLWWKKTPVYDHPGHTEAEKPISNNKAETL